LEIGGVVIFSVSVYVIHIQLATVNWNESAQLAFVFLMWPIYGRQLRCSELDQSDLVLAVPAAPSPLPFY
jgi:hypothetical protein